MAGVNSHQFRLDFHANLHQYLKRPRSRPTRKHKVDAIKPAESGPTSPFLTVLSPEIRNMVYDELCTEDSADRHLGLWCQRTHYHSQILLTCRQIYNEALNLLLTGRCTMAFSVGVESGRQSECFDLKAVLNGVEVPVDVDIPSMLRNAGTLMLGINVEGHRSTTEVGGWRIALSCLNRSLHNLYCHIKTTQIRRIELTIRYHHVSTKGLMELRQILSPAIAAAASMPESTFSLNHPWPVVRNADEAEWHSSSPDPRAFRSLLSSLHDL